ncbi:MAG: universal stress protein, partial [Gemmatimonadaceae bacterium]
PAPFVAQVGPAMRGGLEGFASTLDAREVRVEVRVGEPAEQLALAAAAVGADLVCVGYARARRGIARSGRNTVERLLRRLEVPLLIGAPTVRPLTRLLAAVDGGEGSEGILGAAWALAERLGARLDALHVLDADVRAYARAMSVAVGSPGGAAAAEGELWESATAWLGGALEAAGADSGRCGIRVRCGAPGPELLAECAGSPVELTVVGREGRDALAPGLAGSTTRMILDAATTPVLVVPRLPRPAVLPPDPGPGEERRYSLWLSRGGQSADAAADLVDAGAGDGDGLPPAARRDRRPMPAAGSLAGYLAGYLATLGESA